MIKFDQVSYQYQDRIVLNNVSVNLSRGSFQFLTGPSGSGKSTLLKLCSLDLFPVSGRVMLMDRHTDEVSRDEVSFVRKRIGIVHQNCVFVDHLNIYDNVILPIVAAGLDAENEHQNVIDLLKWIGLGDRIHAYPPELSGGEQQRVALARAVITAPDLILADEPTGNVDWRMAQQILEMLIELNKAGKTVLVATHDYNLIRAAKGKVDTRILRLDKGKLDVAGANL